MCAHAPKGRAKHWRAYTHALECWRVITPRTEHIDKQLRQVYDKGGTAGKKNIEFSVLKTRTGKLKKLTKGERRSLARYTKPATLELRRAHKFNYLKITHV